MANKNYSTIEIEFSEKEAVSRAKNATLTIEVVLLRNGINLTDELKEQIEDNLVLHFKKVRVTVED